MACAPSTAPLPVGWIEARCNAFADSLATAVGTFVRELYLTVAQAINLLALILLHFIGGPRPCAAPGSPGGRNVNLECISESDAEEEPDDVAIFLKAMASGRGPPMLRSVWAFGRNLGEALIAPSPVPYDARDVYMSLGDKLTTGCFEDMYAATLAFVEHWRLAMRTKLFKLHPLEYLQSLAQGLHLLSPRRIFRSDLLDTRTVQHFITGQGYPYEGARVTTKDGYLLHVDRIPQPTSRSVLYFQHGVMDSSYGWVCCGSVQSPAFLGHDRGHDIFLGTMRGTGQSYNRPANVSYNEYWDFTFDHLAIYDVDAVVEHITQTKQAELGPDAPITITIIAHSLGAAATLVFLVHKGLRGEPHAVHRAILMSPAGYHAMCPRFCRVIGWPLYELQRLMKWSRKAPYGLKVTSPWAQVLLAKLFRDIHSQPAVRALVCAAISKYLIGGRPTDLPLYHIHSLAFNLLQSGLTINLMKQFWTIFRRGRFESFDYGPAENQRRYGQPEPLNYMQHYDKVQCAVHFVAGTRDGLIPPLDVLKHYDTLRAHNKDAVFKAVDAGHTDLTMAMSEEALAYIMDVVGMGRAPPASTGRGHRSPTPSPAKAEAARERRWSRPRHRSSVPRLSSPPP